MIERAVEGVGAGFEDDVDLAAGVAGEGGVVIAGEYFEFADGIDGGGDADAVELGVSVVDAVEGEAVGGVAGAVGIEGEVAADGAGGALGGEGDAGDEEGEGLEVAAVEGEVDDLAVVDGGAEGLGVDFEGFVGAKTSMVSVRSPGWRRRSRDCSWLTWRVRLVVERRKPGESMVTL
jgi:hypothetical protein